MVGTPRAMPTHPGSNGRKPCACNPDNCDNSQVLGSTPCSFLGPWGWLCVPIKMYFWPGEWPRRSISIVRSGKMSDVSSIDDLGCIEVCINISTWLALFCLDFEHFVRGISFSFSHPCIIAPIWSFANNKKPKFMAHFILLDFAKLWLWSPTITLRSEMPYRMWPILAIWSNYRHPPYAD